MLTVIHEHIGLRGGFGKEGGGGGGGRGAGMGGGREWEDKGWGSRGAYAQTQSLVYSP